MTTQNARDPNWSLGKFVGTDVKYTEEAKKKRVAKRKSKFPAEGEGEDEAAPELQSEYAARRIDHIVDRFEGCVSCHVVMVPCLRLLISLPTYSGQRCDETNEGRRSAVRFFCCANPAALPQDVQEVRRASDSWIPLFDVLYMNP